MAVGRDRCRLDGAWFSGDLGAVEGVRLGEGDREGLAVRLKGDRLEGGRFEGVVGDRDLLKRVWLAGDQFKGLMGWDRDSGDPVSIRNPLLESKAFLVSLPCSSCLIDLY